MVGRLWKLRDRENPSMTWLSWYRETGWLVLTQM